MQVGHGKKKSVKGANGGQEARRVMRLAGSFNEIWDDCNQAARAVLGEKVIAWCDQAYPAQYSFHQLMCCGWIVTRISLQVSRLWGTKPPIHLAFNNLLFQLICHDGSSVTECRRKFHLHTRTFSAAKPLESG